MRYFTGHTSFKTAVRREVGLLRRPDVMPTSERSLSLETDVTACRYRLLLELRVYSADF